MSPTKVLGKAKEQILHDPVFMRRVNGGLTLFWIAMVPISYSMGWLSSVTYVSALSLWALVSAHWAAWESARVEVHEDEDANVQEVIDLLRKLEKRYAPDSSSDG
jgi:hypothetical protein